MIDFVLAADRGCLRCDWRGQSTAEWFVGSAVPHFGCGRDQRQSLISSLVVTGLPRSLKTETGKLVVHRFQAQETTRDQEETKVFIFVSSHSRGVAWEKASRSENDKRP